MAPKRNTKPTQLTPFEKLQSSEDFKKVLDAYLFADQTLTTDKVTERIMSELERGEQLYSMFCKKPELYKIMNDLNIKPVLTISSEQNVFDDEDFM